MGSLFESKRRGSAGVQPDVKAIVLAIATGLLVRVPIADAGCLEAPEWAAALERHTAPVDGLAGVAVDYAALRAGPGARAPVWQKAVDELAGCRPETLHGPDAMAFWIDAYNVLAIDVVVVRQPAKSIRDVGNLLRPVWRYEAGRIGGQAYSLDAIEHEILRPMGDPRIHAAIVCASLSCPPLRRAPFRGSDLEASLDDQMRRFLADPRKGARLDGDTLWLSRIFDWFEDDFDAVGGVRAFVGPHLPAEIQSALRARPEPPRIRHLDYDWSLNALR